jgi:hypothetical protein
MLMLLQLPSQAARYDDTRVNDGSAPNRLTEWTPAQFCSFIVEKSCSSRSQRQQLQHPPQDGESYGKREREK